MEHQLEEITLNNNETVSRGRLAQVNNRRRDTQERNRLEESVGDRCGKKQSAVIRVITQNIDGIGQEPNSLKERNLKDFVLDKEIDIFGFQQLNVCWSKLKYKYRVWDRFKGWNESYSMSVAFNNQDVTSTPYQPGGTALLTTNKLTYMIDSNGVDDNKLGRWTWVRYKGVDGKFLRVVSIYRPCICKLQNSAYMQAVRYFIKKGVDTCPRKVFLSDLATAILRWKDKGDSIIVMGDFNQDMGGEEISDWKERVGLYDAIGEIRHENLVSPMTFNRGNKQIDAILCTVGIHVVKGGYLPIGEGVGDHRPLFIDISVESTLGVKIPPPTAVKTRRLQLNNPFNQ